MSPDSRLLRDQKTGQSLLFFCRVGTLDFSVSTAEYSPGKTGGDRAE